MSNQRSVSDHSMSGLRLKAAVSVSEMARTLHMSRARFYELVKAGVMPPPCYLIRTRKPFYPSELQSICISVRSQGQGINGEPVVFYANRGTLTKKPSKPKSRSKPKTKLNPMLETLLSGLKQLGVNEPDPVLVKEIVAELYPSGVSTECEGELLTTVFRRLKRRN